MLASGSRGKPPQTGIALVAVLWMVSALAVLAGGLAHTARVELRTAQHLVAEARAAALGDAAVQLAILELRTGMIPADRLQQRRYRLDDQEIQARITPVEGLIDLNQAGEVLLHDLFLYGAGLSGDAALAFAHRVLDWRDPARGKQLHGADAADYEAAGSPARPRAAPFEATEDLRQVLGVTAELYHAVQPYISVYGAGGGGVAALAAPPGVLKVLALGDDAEARRIAGLRDAGEVTIDLTRLKQVHLAQAQAAIFRIEGIMPAGKERRYVRTWWVDIGSPSLSGLPWRTLRREAVRGSRPETLEE